MSHQSSLAKESKKKKKSINQKYPPIFSLFSLYFLSPIIFLSCTHHRSREKKGGERPISINKNTSIYMCVSLISLPFLTFEIPKEPGAPITEAERRKGGERPISIKAARTDPEIVANPPVIKI